MLVMRAIFEVEKNRKWIRNIVLTQIRPSALPRLTSTHSGPPSC
jgi:hypothetical protein